MDNSKGKCGYKPKGSLETTVTLSKDGMYAQFNFLLGRLKTLVDATIPEPVRNKAFKDLMSQEVWHRYNYILELTDKSGKIISDGTVDVT